jgi:3-keto-disaccharide hydrolase
MRSTERRSAVGWLNLLLCTLLIVADPSSMRAGLRVEAQQPPPPTESTAPPQGGQSDAAGRGGRSTQGTGGLPPLNPIDENAPPPPLVTPATSTADPPSDAVVLFDGTDLSKWTLRDGTPARCKVENREMVCRTGDQSIVSKDTYGSAQLHIEYNVPQMEAIRDGKPNGQVKGNSGVFLHGRYEIQVLDSYKNLNKTYPEDPMDRSIEWRRRW